MKKINFIILIIALFASTVSAQHREDSNRLYRLAQAYEQSANYKEALKIYEKLYREKPGNYSYFSGYTRTLTALKRYDEVISICENRLEKSPQDLNTAGLLGSVYYLKGDSEKAFSVWEKAIEMNGSRPFTYQVIANYAIQVRAIEKAIEFLNEGKWKSPSKENFNYELAYLYSMTMAYDKATEEYCDVLKNNSKQFYTVKNRINSLLSSERAQKIISATVERCFDENHNVTIGKLLAFVYQTIGEYDKAFTLICELDGETNGGGTLIFNFAKNALKNNNFETVKNAYEYLLENYPNAKFIPEVKYGLARALIEIEKLNSKKNSAFVKPIAVRNKIPEKKFSEATKLLDELAGSSTAGNFKSQSLFALANLYMNEIGNYKKADSLFSMLSKISRENKFYFASILQKSKIALLLSDSVSEKAFEKIRKDLKQLTNIPNSFKEIKSEAQYYLALTYFWSGKFTEAISGFEQIARDKNNDFANDAIEKKLIISMFKADSLSLLKFAKADFYIFTEQFDKAISNLKPLAGNKNLFMLNNLAKYKIAEIYVAEDKYPEAVKLLVELVENNLPEIFPDKAMKLLGDIYFYVFKNYDEALKIYNNFLEKYETSLYLNEIRNNIKFINETVKNGEEK